MLLDTISSQVMMTLTKDLADALVYFSEKAITQEKANFMAEKTMKSVDLHNSAFAHKGINWLAKELLKTIN